MAAPTSKKVDDKRIVAPNVVSIRSEQDIIAARMAARDVARKIGFNAVDQARIAMAASNLARNIVLQAGEGSVTINQIQRDREYGIELVFEDQRQGADADAPPAAAAPTLLPDASQDLMDEIDTTNATDSGTRITCRKWRR